MAETQTVDLQDGSQAVDENDVQEEVTSVSQSSKRCSSPTHYSGPPVKSARTDSSSPPAQTSSGEEQPDLNKKDALPESSGETTATSAKKKSWRRATMTRRSLPVIPESYHTLCHSISMDLSPKVRLERLLEASMKLALRKAQESVQSVPNSSLESFLKQGERIQAEWSTLIKSVHHETHELPSSSTGESGVKKFAEKIQTAIKSLEDESNAWEELLNKHRTKAQEFERQVEQGEQTGILLDCASMRKSSQYHVISSKPDYCGLLSRQKPILQTMELIMDAQCAIVKELSSMAEMSQILLKETSGRLAEEAGFQVLSTEILRNLMLAPSSNARA